MTVFCTYCSAKKKKASKPVPAVELYVSNRIDSTHQASKQVGLDFCILSGKYGLLDADDTINTYDHLLVQEEIVTHAKIVANQIQQKNIKTIIFFHIPTSVDKYNKAYIDCIKLAAGLSNTELSLVEITIPE